MALFLLALITTETLTNLLIVIIVGLLPVSGITAEVKATTIRTLNVWEIGDGIVLTLVAMKSVIVLAVVKLLVITLLDAALLTYQTMLSVQINVSEL